MNVYAVSLLLIGLLQDCVAPPVIQKDNNDSNNITNTEEDKYVGMGSLEDYLEYHRYLKEVVNALESDPEFRQKLVKADENDVKTGKIAEELEFVSHHVRTRLDELKRIELDRLRELTMKQQQLTGNRADYSNHQHLDHSNPHTFEIEDLKKLISKTTELLAEADKLRREEFKAYEMKKEYERQKKLNETNGAEREKLEKQYKELEEKHKKHEKLHEPGHKAQLEEVWEKQDQMQQEFDPKTFFMLHDIDGNGLWDQLEVKALFVKELEKMYAEGHPEDDMRERAEEMERMRESVFREVDLNRDGFIDFGEFLSQTKRNDFQQDHGWKGLDEQRPYTDEELQEYIWREQMRQQQRQGYPQHPQQYQQFNQPPPQHYPQPNVQYQQHPNVQPPPPGPHYQHPNMQQANFHHPQQPNVQQYPQQPNLQQHPPPKFQQHSPSFQQQPQQANFQQQAQQPNYQHQQPNVQVPQQHQAQAAAEVNVQAPQQPPQQQQQPNVEAQKPHAQPPQGQVPQQVNVPVNQQPNVQVNDQPLDNNIPQNIPPEVNQV